MRTENTPELFTELWTDSPAEIVRIIKEARRMRGEAQDELLRSAGRGIVRLVSLVSRPPALATGFLGLTARMKRASRAEPALR